MQYVINCQLINEDENCSSPFNMVNNNIKSLDPLGTPAIIYSVLEKDYWRKPQTDILYRATQIYDILTDMTKFKSASYHDKMCAIEVAAFLALMKEYGCNELMKYRISPTNSKYHYIAFDVNNDDYYHYRASMRPTQHLNDIRNSENALGGNNYKFMATIRPEGNLVQLIDPPNEVGAIFDINELIDKKYRQIKKWFHSNYETKNYNGHEYLTIKIGGNSICGIDSELMRHNHINKYILAQLYHSYDGNTLIYGGILVEIADEDFNAARLTE